MQRRHHYEQAFEAYLRRRRIPYVAVDEAKKALLPPSGTVRDEHGVALKSFDFVIYGESSNLLVECKGRRVLPRVGRCDAARPPKPARLECWVTREDVDSLVRWERLFGGSFAAAFVFVYWCDELPPDALFEEIFEFGGRWYAIRCVRLSDYREFMRVRSAKWGTVDLPQPVFDRVSGPLAPPTPQPVARGQGVGWTLRDVLLADPPPLPSMDRLVLPP